MVSQVGFMLMMEWHISWMQSYYILKNVYKVLFLWTQELNDSFFAFISTPLSSQHILQTAGSSDFLWVILQMLLWQWLGLPCCLLCAYMSVLCFLLTHTITVNNYQTLVFVFSQISLPRWLRFQHVACIFKGDFFGFSCLFHKRA